MTPTLFKLPVDPAHFLRKKNAIKAELAAQPGLLQKRIAVIGGSTTAEVVEQLEIFLLAHGFRPEFFQGEYNRYYEDALFPDERLKSFRPDLVYIHTTAMNIREFPRMQDSPTDVDALLQQQLQHFEAVWAGIGKNLGCAIIQNNFEQPWYRPLGNLDATDYRGRSRFVARLNELFANAAASRRELCLHDIHYLSARFGMQRWFNPRNWYLYKYALDMEMIPFLAQQLGAVMAAHWDSTGKGLVLDLDNTLWGGVIGDDGVDGILVGNESPEAEAFTEFQHYARLLKERGIILAVCSKNDETNARAGFSHPDSVLTPDDFSSFKANWEPKPANIEAIARELNIGVDSLVFVDDNPVERDMVRAQLPAVTVPEPGAEISDYIRALDEATLFEAVSLSHEDTERALQYRDNTRREQHQARFASYDEFLASLEMKADIRPFEEPALGRITQLINKTNQFNLTTKRCTAADVQAMAESSSWIVLSGRLRDKFGDNGLVSVVAGQIRDRELHLELWLMSCRVLKRGMEYAMLQQLLVLAQQRRVQRIVGYFRPTSKNAMVKDFYGDLGFTRMQESAVETRWQLELSAAVKAPQHFIQRLDQ